jgi:hypothetical protein
MTWCVGADTDSVGRLADFRLRRVGVPWGVASSGRSTGPSGRTPPGLPQGRGRHLRLDPCGAEAGPLRSEEAYIAEHRYGRPPEHAADPH